MTGKQIANAAEKNEKQLGCKGADKGVCSRIFFLCVATHVMPPRGKARSIKVHDSDTK